MNVLCVFCGGFTALYFFVFALFVVASSIISFAFWWHNFVTMHDFLLRLGSSQPIHLYVQHAGVLTKGPLQLDARMSRGVFLSDFATWEGIERLFSAHYDPVTRLRRPLAMLDVSKVSSALIEYEGKMIATAKLVRVDQASLGDGLTLFVAKTEEIKIEITVRSTLSATVFEVWRVHCTVPSMTSARINHVLTSSVARVSQPLSSNTKNSQLATLRQHWDDANLPEPSSNNEIFGSNPVDSCISVDLPTFDARIASDAAYTRGLSIGYSVEAGHSLLHTDIGTQLLTAHASPSTTIKFDPKLWVDRVASVQATPRSEDYLQKAQELGDRLDNQLISGWAGDLWRGMQGLVPDRIKNLLPQKPENVETLKNFDLMTPEEAENQVPSDDTEMVVPIPKTEVDWDRIVAGAKKAGGVAKKIDQSQTASAVIGALTSTADRDGLSRLEFVAKAFAADVDMDPNGATYTLVKQAPKVKAAMEAAAEKLRYLKAEDVKPYIENIRKIYNNEDLRTFGSWLAKASKAAMEKTASAASKVL